MDPLEPPPKACIIWMPDEDTSAIFLGPAPSALAPDAELPPTIDAADRIGDNDENVLLYDLGNGQRVQIDRGTTAPIGKPLAALIPLNSEGFDRLEAVSRLLASLHGKAIPRDTRLTAQQRMRSRRMLQCFDGHRDGATQQEIAQVVFHTNPLDRHEWQESSARHSVKSLLRDARAMIAGGYRALLRHRRQS